MLDITQINPHVPDGIVRPTAIPITPLLFLFLLTWLTLSVIRTRTLLLVNFSIHLFFPQDISILQTSMPIKNRAPQVKLEWIFTMVFLFFLTQGSALIPPFQYVVRASHINQVTPASEPLCQ